MRTPFFPAIVKIEARAVPDARSAATLGTEREGTGVIIARDGLTLTIGYLLIEADEVRIVDDRGRTLPARVVAYDHVSGLGLVRPMVPLEVAPIALGDSSRLAASDPVLIVNRGGRDEATRALVVSRRMFTGNWEYLLESAIFTSPPTLNWSGAALIGDRRALLGVGSLIVREASYRRAARSRQHVRSDRGAQAGPRRPRRQRATLRARRGRGWASPPTRSMAGSSWCASRPAARRIAPVSAPATSSSGSAATACARRRSSTASSGAKRIAGATVPLRVLQGIDVTRSRFARSTGSNTSSRSPRIERRRSPSARERPPMRRIGDSTAGAGARRGSAPRRSGTMRAAPRRGGAVAHHDALRSHHFRQRLPAVSGAAGHGQADSSLVRRRSRGVDDLPRLFPDHAAARLRLRRSWSRGACRRARR